ncbi:MAG: efflux RND transporter periplasmic adaptor subunit [Candidatus Tectimicrobiota bacterium]
MARLCHAPVRYLLGALLLCVAACAPQPAASPPPASPPKVTVSQPVLREVVEWEEYTGRLEAVEAVEVRARVNGYLQAIHFKDGSNVKKGDLLFIIDPRPYQAELERARAELGLAVARGERAGKDLARVQMLLRAHAASEEEVDARIAEQRQTREAVQAAQAMVNAAQLNVEFTQVRAPISGRIGRNLVSVGNLINGGSPQSTLLTTIVSLDPIYCYFEAPERFYLKDLRLLRGTERPNGRDRKQSVEMALANEEGFPHKGDIDFIDNRLDTQTGTITVRAVLPNPDALLAPGLFARLRTPAGSAYRALLLPPEAVGTDLSQQFVFVVDAQHLVQYRKVTLGPLLDGQRVIREGVQADDWVIVNGIQRARAGIKVEPIQQPPNEAQAALPATTTRVVQKSRGGR